MGFFRSTWNGFVVQMYCTNTLCTGGKKQGAVNVLLCVEGLRGSLEKCLLPVYPRLWALGEFGEGQFAQVEVLLWAQRSALQQLLPATTIGHALRQTFGGRRLLPRRGARRPVGECIFL